MTSCGSCGASNPSTAAWCSQCYGALTPAPSASPVPSPAPRPAPQPVGPPPPWSAHYEPGQYIPPQYPPAEHAAHYPPEHYVAPPQQSTAQYSPPPPEGLRSGRATWLVVSAIGVGGILQLVFLVLSHGRLSVEALVRYDLFGTLVFYGVVLLMISTQLRGAVRLRWATSSRAAAIALGVAVGGGLAGVMTLALANITGSITTDPNIALLASEGDAAHIVAVVLVTVVAAPVVEELLFRGLFAESLRQHGGRVAVIISSVAFAIWHFRPAELRYYAIMGALLGTLYWKRGLLCSMSAHATFNGVLTAIAVWLAVAPGHLTTVGGLEVEAPRGWHQPVSTSPQTAQQGLDKDMVLRGPSGATLLVLSTPMPVPVTAERLVERAGAIASNVPADVHVDAASAHVTDLPMGEAAELDVTAKGDTGRLVMVPHGTTLYVVVFEGGGSAKAERDFERMLSSASAVGP